MPLVTSREMLLNARRDQYAVPAFNVLNMEMVQAVISACEAEQSPLIVQFNPGGLRHTGLSLAAAMATAAAREANVPVAVHLDHVNDFALHIQALRAGFTSLMFDGSPWPFDRNAEATASVCEMAHAVDIPVEGELGAIGGREEGVEFAEAQMTDPVQAERFVSQTNVDSLAVSVGNTHGQSRGATTLDLDRLQRIHETAGVPLVLHGGSGVSDEQMKLAIHIGICKVNVATELHRVYVGALRSHLEQNDATEARSLMEPARAAFEEAAREKVRLFGASGRA